MLSALSLCMWIQVRKLYSLLQQQQSPATILGRPLPVLSLFFGSSTCSRPQADSESTAEHNIPHTYYYTLCYSFCHETVPTTRVVVFQHVILHRD